MATIRKVTRQNKDGSATVRYLVRWLDRDGKQRSRKFKLRAAADRKLATVTFRLETDQSAEGVEAGTFFDAFQAWLDHFEKLVKAGKREHSTWAQYDQHLRCHVAEHEIARAAVKTLSAPECQEFASWLERTRSHAMACKVMTSVRMVLDHTVKRGLIAINPAATITIDGSDRSLLSDEDAEAQERAVIPELHEVRAVLEAARSMNNEDQGRALALFTLITFPGLRISELRGLGMQHLQLFGDQPTVKVRRRADASGRLGAPKSKAGYRTITLAEDTVTAVRAWIPHVTPSTDALVFATAEGKPYSYSHLYRHVLVPVMTRATMAMRSPHRSLVTLRPTPDNDGAPIVRNAGHFAGPYCPLTVRPRYSFHDFRHVAASLWIAAGANPKQIQKWMGHSSLNVTMDIYGHLWNDPENDAAMARAAERAVRNARK